MTTDEVIYNDLDRRIKEMRKRISAAEQLLNQDNYIQCAVRLQLAAQEAQFDELLLAIYDSQSIRK